jgi:RNA polymerase sigma-70 factor, ECF subfamily
MNSKEEEFKKLIEEQKARIQSVCRYFSKDQADQKDLYQEILINTWKGMDSFRGDAKPGTWMYRIAVNTAMGFAGKTKKRLQFSLSLEKSNLKSFTDEELLSFDPENEWLLGEMEICINQLSVIDKVLITLLLEDLSYREIADVVGITEPNVRVKIHRIKNELHNKMKGASHENNE